MGHERRAPEKGQACVSRRAASLHGGASQASPGGSQTQPVGLAPSGHLPASSLLTPVPAGAGKTRKTGLKQVSRFLGRKDSFCSPPLGHLVYASCTRVLSS